MATSLLSARNPDEALRISRLREKFLSREQVDLTTIRSVVARSWYRSRAAGVDGLANRGVTDEGRVDALTLRAAEPALKQLDAFAADLGGYVSLTAPNGVLTAPPFLRDAEGFGAGYSLLEENCGSNGEGLALEEGRSVWLAPEEHFREDMRGNWCFASLIRDPFHSRIRAVIGMTFPAKTVGNIDPASTLLVLEAVAARVTREIEATSAAKERVLLNEYLMISRRHGGAAVIAMDGKNTVMNSAATASLQEGDFSIVSGYAKDVMSRGRVAQCEVNLQGPGTVTMEISPVHLAPARVGAIAVIRPRSEDPATDGAEQPAVDWPPLSVDDLAAEVDGISAEFHRTLRLVRTAIAHDRSVLLVGERGTGKQRLALAIARRRGECPVIDCEDPAVGGSKFSAAMRWALENRPAALVLENADAMLRPQAQELMRLLKREAGTGLIMTATRPTDATALVGEARDALEIAVAPLRNRREDIALLANAFARELGEQRELSRKLLAELTNSEWPENLDQLRAVVSNAIERSRGNEVTVDDLPQGFHRALSNGRLSRLEDAELSELRRALQEAKGNRRLAAELLQIGRSTLYRRMDYFRSRGFEL